LEQQDSSGELVRQINKEDTQVKRNLGR